MLCECHLALAEQWAASPGIAFALLSVDCTSALGYILTYNKVALIPLIWKGIGEEKIILLAIYRYSHYLLQVSSISGEYCFGH